MRDYTIPFRILAHYEPVLCLRVCQVAVAGVYVRIKLTLAPGSLPGQRYREHREAISHRFAPRIRRECESGEARKRISVAGQKIRIRLKAYDHEAIDASAKKIVETVTRTGARVVGPVPLPTEKNVYAVI